MSLQVPESIQTHCVKHVQPFVEVQQGAKSLHFTVGQLQSSMWTDRPHELQLGYTKAMMGFLLLHQQPRHIAMIGLGGGSLAKYCHQLLPESSFTAVEINPHVIAMRDEFSIPQDSARFKVIEADGADFVRRCQSELDVLLVDGYDHQGQPQQLCSLDFYAACKQALTPHGVLVVNLCESHPQYERFIERIDRVFDGNFAEIVVEDDANVIVFASRDMKIWPNRLRKNIYKYGADWVQWRAHIA